MWHCPACEYLNDEPDAACLRCSAQRPPSVLPAQDSGEGTIVAQVPVSVSSTSASDRPAGRRRSPAVAVVIVLLLLLGGAGVVYAAWLRGLITLPDWLDSRLPQFSLELPGQRAVRQPVSEQPARSVIAAERMLEELEALPAGRTRALTNAVVALGEVSHLLDQVEREPEPQAEDSAARAAQLNALRLILPDLLAAYEDFETAAARLQSADTGETLVGIRAEYKGAMFRFIDLLGRAYLQDPDVARVEYLLAEQIQQPVAARGRIDPQELKERWLAAVAAREERIVDDKFTVEYEGLAVRRATLYQLRKNFNDAAQALPPADMVRDTLSPGAAQLLELYDAFAFKIEDLWEEWTQFSATLPPRHERPRRMEEERRSIEELFASEHMDCYTQMYRFYSMDRELTHPVYDRLVGEHYYFVQAQWPNHAHLYRAIAAQYEGEWDRVFRPNRDRTRGDGSGGGIDLQGPPGYNP